MRNSLERLKASYQAAILPVVPLTTAQEVAENAVLAMTAPVRVQKDRVNAAVPTIAQEVAENVVLAMTAPVRVQMATANAEVRTTAPVVEESADQDMTVQARAQEAKVNAAAHTIAEEVAENVVLAMTAPVHNGRDYAESISFSLYSNNTKRSKIHLYQSEYSSLGGY